MDEVEVWRWIWLGAGVLFSVGEIAIAGAFFLLPFGIGALVASAALFMGASLVISWVVFLVVSGLAFAALFPLGRRLDRTSAQNREAVGAGRWVGRLGNVLEVIPAGPGETGLVRVDREQWRAESSGRAPIETGTMIRVLQVDGTRLIVEPVPEEAASGPDGTAGGAS
ncbi:MAG TPA: NfeD family protein [Actinomycetota bacterium]